MVSPRGPGHLSRELLGRAGPGQELLGEIAQPVGRQELHLFSDLFSIDFRIAVWLLLEALARQNSSKINEKWNPNPLQERC